jgi:hypothetical protein
MEFSSKILNFILFQIAFVYAQLQSPRQSCKTASDCTGTSSIKFCINGQCADDLNYDESSGMVAFFSAYLVAILLLLLCSCCCFCGCLWKVKKNYDQTRKARIERQTKFNNFLSSQPHGLATFGNGYNQPYNVNAPTFKQ